MKPCSAIEVQRKSTFTCARPGAKTGDYKY